MGAWISLERKVMLPIRLKDTHFLPASVGNITPLGQYAHQKCYASELKGCSSKISLEHYLSHAVLKVLNGDRDYIVVEEASVNRRVPAKTFGANVLCTKHNEALSPLDTVGMAFFAALHQVGPVFSRQAEHANQVVADVNGYDIERWLLKILVGLACGVLPETKRNWRPPRQWLRILYGKREMPRNCGLSCRLIPGQDLGNDPRIGLAPLWVEDENPPVPGGLLARLGNIEFTLLMKNKTRKRLETYRPSAFRFTSVHR